MVQRNPLTAHSVIMVVALAAVLLIFLKPVVEDALFRAMPNYELGVGAGNGDLALIDDALAHGANINDNRSLSGRTPLMVAALKGRDAAVRYLLAHGADPTLRDDQGNTAAELAVRRSNRQVAELLNHPPNPAHP